MVAIISGSLGIVEDIVGVGDDVVEVDEVLEAVAFFEVLQLTIRANAKRVNKIFILFCFV